MFQDVVNNERENWKITWPKKSNFPKFTTKAMDLVLPDFLHNKNYAIRYIYQTSCITKPLKELSNHKGRSKKNLEKTIRFW